jgi:hypothetical protein
MKSNEYHAEFRHRCNQITGTDILTTYILATLVMLRIIY